MNTICSGCGGNLSSMVFYEDGKPYHFGCRPSQQMIIGVATSYQLEHADLLARITELRLELTRVTWVADRESDLAEVRHHRWYQEKRRADTAATALAEVKTSLTLSRDKNVRLRAAFDTIAERKGMLLEALESDVLRCLPSFSPGTKNLIRAAFDHYRPCQSKEEGQ